MLMFNIFWSFKSLNCLVDYVRASCKLLSCTRWRNRCWSLKVGTWRFRFLVGPKIREHIHITISLPFCPSKSLSSYCEVSFCSMCLLTNKSHALCCYCYCIWIMWKAVIHSGALFLVFKCSELHIGISVDVWYLCKKWLCTKSNEKILVKISGCHSST
jgi:hypothetical protein